MGNDWKNNNKRSNDREKVQEYIHTVELTPKNYVEEADKVIKSLADNHQLPSTSKLRNILSMVSELRTDAQHSRDTKLSDDMQSRVQYLKMRVAYEIGRDKNPNRKPWEKKGKVENFFDNSGMIKEISNIGDDKKNLLLFGDYMEALTAYHKYYGGKEN